MKKSLKGFTLIEMIIVLALFSLIMYSVVQLLDPVTKFYVRSSNFESTTACVDNIKRSIEGNLKYADRVRAYVRFYPYAPETDTTIDMTTGGSVSSIGNNLRSYVKDPDVSDSLKEHLTSFYDYYFQDRKAVDSAGYIYVLVFDNTHMNSEELKAYPSVSDFTGTDAATGKTKILNSGKMILYKFWFNNYDTNYNSADGMLSSIDDGAISYTDDWLPSSVNPGITDWYVNEKMYGNYEYHFTLGSMNASGLGSGASIEITNTDDSGNPVFTFNPADFTIQIEMTELRKDPDTGGLTRVASTENAYSSFSMKNVLDPNAAYSRPLIDYLLTGNEEVPGFKYTAVQRNRYAPMTSNITAAYSANIDKFTDGFDGFYFIYTLPETTYTNGENFANQALS